MKNLKISIIMLLGLCSLESIGATLTLKDGSRLEGEVIQVFKGEIEFKTSFAGTLKIKQSEIAGIISEEPLSVRTSGGEVYKGQVASLEDGQLTVRSSSGTVETKVQDIESVWLPGAEDPVQAARVGALEGQLRTWSYQLGLDLSGSFGNTEKLSNSLSFEAKLEGPEDRLIFYGKYLYSEEDSIKSQDEQVGGVNYTNFFGERLGWYVRQELERDTFEGINFRSTTAAGLTYRFIKQPDLTLEGRAGLSYRFEDYIPPAVVPVGFVESDDYPGLDIGLNLSWKFAEWGKLVSSVTYTPSLDDFGTYLLDHESGIDIPLAMSNAWKLRIGVSNQYNSDVTASREKLDTTYFLRMILSWD